MDKRKMINTYLINLIVKYTSLKPEDIREETYFEELGINSFMMLEMVSEMDEVLKVSLSKTIFFEYSCLKDLREFLEKNYANLFGNEEKESEEEELFLIEDDFL